jgi:hypothetical protein
LFCYYISCFLLFFFSTEILFSPSLTRRSPSSVLGTLLRDAAQRGADVAARARSSDAATDDAIFAHVVDSARAGGYHAVRDAGRDAAGAAGADHGDALFTAAPLFPSEVYGRLAAAAHDGAKPSGIHGWTKSHSGLEEAGTTDVRRVGGPDSAGECSCMYRYTLRESCSQFDSLPLTSLTISPHVFTLSRMFVA